MTNISPVEFFSCLFREDLSQTRHFGVFVPSCVCVTEDSSRRCNLDRDLWGRDAYWLSARGWACSHSFSSAIDLERISIDVYCLFSKVKRFLLIHKLQQIQAKILSKVPIGGMFTFVSEDCKVVLKEEQARGFSGAVQGHRSQTALAGSQWKSMCSKVSSAPHHAHRVCFVDLFFSDFLLLVDCLMHIAK